MGKTYSEAVEKLTAELGKMPGIGRKTAERLTYYVLELDRAEALALADAVREVTETVKKCSDCFLLSDSDPCHICSDPERDRTRLCVVEDSQDAAGIEESGAFSGLYHVLCGRVAPLEGIEPEDLTVPHLLRRIARGGYQEVIIATNPDVEGDATALFVNEALDGTGVRVSRIARGVPSGSNLRYANAAMLGEALRRRRKLDD